METYRRNKSRREGAGRGPGARVALPAAILLVSAGLSFGQDQPRRHMINLSTGGLFPVGAFNEHVSQEGFALGVQYGVRLRKAPVYVGFELSAGFYGYTHRHEYMNGIPEVRLDVETFNNIVQGHFLLRAEARRGAVRPFVEGLAGLSYLFTDTTISEHEFPWEEVASDINSSDLTLAAGAGGGLAIRLGWSRRRHPDRARGETVIEVKVRYMAGGRAKYLKQGSIVIEDGEAVYTFERSATSFVSAQLGISFRY